MIKHFPKISEEAVERIHAHPDKNVSIYGFRQMELYDFLLLPIIDEEDNQKVNDNYVYCIKCSKWLKTSSTFGNIKAHMKGVHQLFNNEMTNDLNPIQKGILARKMILMNGLPFVFIENELFRKICGHVGTRKTLSNMCSQVAEKVRRSIKWKFANGVQSMWITIDEWTDKNTQNYLGVWAKIATKANTIESICIAHQPLTAIHCDAPYISGVLSEILTYYFPRNSVEGIVSDTTPLMPAVAAQMSLKWRPCYCHVMNLLLQSLIDFCSEHLDQLFALQRTLGSSTIFHNYVVQNNSIITALPSVTETRWYSLFKLMKNTIALQPHIESFLRANRYDSIGELSGDFFINLAALLRVFGTAKNVMMHLESSKFGTLSLVIDSFRLVKWSVDNLPEAFSEVKESFEAEYSQRWLSHFSEECHHSELLMAVRLNPYQMLQTSIDAEEIAQTDALIATKMAEIQNSQITPSSSQPKDTDSQQDGSAFQYGFTFTHFRDAQRVQVNELEVYSNMLLNFRGNDDGNVYEFWNSNRLTIPTLSRMAIHLLLQPATSADAERQFSKAKRVIGERYMSYYRASLLAGINEQKQNNRNENIKPFKSFHI